MKKRIFSILTVLMSLLFLVGIFGCQKVPATSSATALGIVHDHYLGVAEITVKKDGSVVDFNFDEVFLPYNWAKKVPQGENSSFTHYWTVDGVEKDYARYIRIDNKYFEATASSDPNVTYPIWKEINGSINDLEAELGEKADLRQWYYNAVKAGKVAIVKSTDNGFEDEKDPAKNSYGSMFKSTSSYWPEGGRGKGWKANIQAIENYVKEHGVDFQEGDLDQDKDTNIWYIGDVETGATLKDFKQYMNLVKVAYEEAMKV
ncbi:MAG TPA: hypothetical protein VIL24_01805, partial [Clostridia bacterium]